MTPPELPFRALTIAGSDPSGGAGLQADIAVFTRLGVHPMGLPTALTVQNSLGVRQVAPLPADSFASQLHHLLSDMPPQAAKTGMLADDDIVAALGDIIEGWSVPHLVVDPVRTASSGTSLLSDAGHAALIKHILPHTSLLTPNRYEAEQLWGKPVPTPAEAARCALALREMGPKAVLITGGHLQEKGHVVDTLADDGGVTTWRHPRYPGPSPHGTGCALSAAITAHLATGTPLREAVRRALTYVSNAIRNASSPGGGRPYLGDGTVSPVDEEQD